MRGRHHEDHTETVVVLRLDRSLQSSDSPPVARGGRQKNVVHIIFLLTAPRIARAKRSRRTADRLQKRRRRPRRQLRESIQKK